MSAGLASVFGAPLAGIAYAFEEFMSLRKLGAAACLIALSSTAACSAVELLKDFKNKMLNIPPWQGIPI